MAILIDGIPMPKKCAECALEHYDPKSSLSFCAITGQGVAWCRTEHRPNSCPLSEEPCAPSFEVTEMCPHCESEITMTWDVSCWGFKAFCPVCGKRLMLCDECQHRGKNGAHTGDCDYSSETDSCRFNKIERRM